MIHFNLQILNPWTERFDYLWGVGRKLSKNKAVELQVCRCTTILELSFAYTVNQDHAGLRIIFALLGYDISFNIYDTRHWNYDLKTWEKHSE